MQREYLKTIRVELNNLILSGVTDKTIKFINGVPKIVTKKKLHWLKVYCQSVRGLRTTLLQSTLNADYDIIILTETWLTKDIFTHEIFGSLSSIEILINLRLQKSLDLCFCLCFWGFINVLVLSCI